MLLMTTSILPSLKMSPNAAPRPTAHYREPGAFDGGNQRELAVLLVVIKKRPLRIALPPLRVLVHLGVDMAVDNQQILPAVVVVVQKAVAKAHKGYGRLGNARLITDIREESRSVVLEEDIVIVGKIACSRSKDVRCSGNRPRRYPYSPLSLPSSFRA